MGRGTFLKYKVFLIFKKHPKPEKAGIAMDKILKVIVTDDRTIFGRDCIEVLSCYGMEVSLCESNGIKLMKQIKENRPDVVLTDIFLRDMDLLELLSSKEFGKHREQTLVMVMTNRLSTALERETLLAGASCCLRKPCDFNVLADCIINLFKEREQEFMVQRHNESTELNKMITNLIQELGIPPNLKGYYYIREAVALCFNDYNMLSCMMKLLYPTVARKYETTPTGVEAAIRHAIEIAWYKSKGNTFKSQFGYTIYSDKCKPTNSELIAVITEELHCSLKNAAAIICT